MPANLPIDPRAAIDRFMAERRAGPVGSAMQLPDLRARPTDCIANVLSKVDRDGGLPVFGWTFLNRFNSSHGNYLVATHHAVWHCPRELRLIDITPLHPDERHRPITDAGGTIFLVDRNALPHRVAKIVMPLPLEFVAVGNEPGLQTYLGELRKSEDIQWREQLSRMGRFPP